MNTYYKHLRHTVALASIIFLCTPAIKADKVRTYTTNAEGSLMLERKDFSTSASCGNNIITLCPSITHQSMDGFGYAITYSTCYNLLKMKDRDRHRFLVNTFSPTKGLGASYIRTSIGCSDFSSTEYSLCDHPGLSNFALHDDEIHYVIPIIKEILDINPHIKIIAAPWTCPKWMKVKNLKTLEKHDSWTSGHLNPEMRDTYAQYFVKFVEAFAQQGIHIYAVTPQNEPLNQGNCASLFMPWDEQAEFIPHLAAAFKKAGLTTKIYCFDHNWNYDNMQEQKEYPARIFDALTNEYEGSELVVGSAWHDYGGEASELDHINRLIPDKEVIFTEASIGTWNDGRNLQKRLLTDMNRLVYNTVTRQCRAVMVWNLMLDLKRGPNLDGGCTTCYGAVDIDDRDYKTIHMNSHYFVIAHSSAVVQPGAKRIGQQTKGCNNINSIAFQNPDGTLASLLINNGKNDTEVSITSGTGSVANVEVPARSVVSVLIGKPIKSKNKR